MHAAETSVEDRSIFFYDRKGKVARELEQAGYVVRSRTRNPKGQLANAEYVIYEHPMPASRSAPKPAREKPVLENPTQEKPAQEDPTQLKKQESNTNPEKNETNRFYPSYPSGKARAGPLAGAGGMLDRVCRAA